MSLNEYKPGTTFTGRMGRTVSESEPAWPAPVRSNPHLVVVEDQVGIVLVSVAAEEAVIAVEPPSEWPPRASRSSWSTANPSVRQIFR
jgi:hypothetical protein